MSKTCLMHTFDSSAVTLLVGSETLNDGQCKWHATAALSGPLGGTKKVGSRVTP